jgi:tetratricopeptide (TPR) repeat protein
MIKGYVRDEQGRALDFPNHAWNSVLIDGKWYLLDVTWASLSLPDKGTLDLKQEQLNHFFLVDPRIMILTHLPEDPIWQLQKSCVPLEVFELGKEAIQTRIETSSDHGSSDFAYQIAAYEALDSLERAIAYLERMVENNRNTAREYGLAIAYYYKARDLLQDEARIDPLTLEKNRQEARYYYQRSLAYLSSLQEHDIGYDFSRDLVKNLTFRMEILQ